MFDVADAGRLSEAELRARYAAELGDAVRELGIDSAAERTGIDRSTLAALADVAAGGDGAVPVPALDIELEPAATLVAAAGDDTTADPAAVAAQARDRLLLGMTTAVLDVEAVESGIDGRMEAKEIQQKVEGRFPMTVEEYAVLHRFIEARR